MAQIEQSDKGKKKKGAQKKMSIHVDFTPMVDMNMLLITFFMLCTTMIKPQTLQIALPTNEKVQNQDEGTKAKESDAVTLILDTERDENGHVKMITDPETGQTYPDHIIYYYEGKPLNDREGGVPAKVADVDADGDGIIDSPDEVKLKVQYFRGNTNNQLNGIRAILHQRNKEVLNKVDSVKALYKAGKLAVGKDANKDSFDVIARRIRNDKELKRPVLIIKPGPDASFENVISALDEMQINQIGQYQINTINSVDSMLIRSYKAHGLTK